MNCVYYATYSDYSDYLEHHGILGQKWGVRRYQNEDGSYTKEGLDRRKKINTALAIAGGIGIATGVTVGSGSRVAGRVAGSLAATTIKSALDDRAEKKGKKNKNTYHETEEEKAKREEQYTKDAEHYKKNAAGYKTEKINRLNSFIKENEQMLSDRLGTKSVKETRQYLMDSLKAYNELDPDQVVFQYMDNAPDLFDKGYIDVNTFSKLYDATVADEIPDYVGYDGDGSRFRQWNELYNNHMKNESQEDRLNKMFGKSTSVTHYDANKFIYYATEY